MFFKNRQEQIVDVNKLIDQTREGDQDRYKVRRIEKFLTREVRETQKSFPEELERKREENKECYSFYYPFVMFGSDVLETIAGIIEYDLPEEIQRQMEEDYEKAVAWNEELARKGAIKDDEREMCGVHTL